MSEIELSDASFEKEVTQAGQPVLVDIWAPWCGPCRMLAPVIEELASEYAGRAKVARLDSDENPVTAFRFGVSAIPTLLFFKDGKIADRVVGVQPKSEIKRRLDALLA